MTDDTVSANSEQGSIDKDDLIAQLGVTCARLRKENERLRAALESALPLVAYLSHGRRYVETVQVPDAQARKANAEIREVLGIE